LARIGSSGAPLKSYPSGSDTEFDRPVEQQLSAEALEQWKRDWTGFAIGSQFFRIEDEKNGDFKTSFEHALRSYARDADRARPKSVSAGVLAVS